MAPTRVWSFGEEAYTILRDYIFLRERLRPYLHAQAAETSRTGIPIMRPLLVEFPEDPASWEVDDQFMFGRDVMAAPVLQHGAREQGRVPARWGGVDKCLDWGAHTGRRARNR